MVLFQLLNLVLDVDVARVLSLLLQSLHQLNLLLISLLLILGEVLVLPRQLKLLHVLRDR